MTCPPPPPGLFLPRRALLSSCNLFTASRTSSDHRRHAHRKGDWPIPPKCPLVGGHEGAGRIVAIGEGSDTQFKVGSKVGIKWLADRCAGPPLSLSPPACPTLSPHVAPRSDLSVAPTLTLPLISLACSCLNCEACLGGQEATCSNAKLSGYTVDGSFQQCVSSPPRLLASPRDGC